MVVNSHSIELSRDEIVQRLETAARRFNMTVTQFLTAYRHGTLADPGAVADVVALADLLTDEDPLRERRIA